MSRGQTPGHGRELRRQVPSCLPMKDALLLVDVIQDFRHEDGDALSIRFADATPRSSPRSRRRAAPRFQLSTPTTTTAYGTAMQVGSSGGPSRTAARPTSSNPSRRVKETASSSSRATRRSATRRSSSSCAPSGSSGFSSRDSHRDVRGPERYRREGGVLQGHDPRRCLRDHGRADGTHWLEHAERIVAAFVERTG
jgi:hypothetical protein